MQHAFAKAFETWEREYRENPSAFMSRAEMNAERVESVAEAQARVFVSYLNELAQGKPWDQIAK